MACQLISNELCGCASRKKVKNDLEILPSDRVDGGTHLDKR
jgi:hypothetical protein